DWRMVNGEGGAPDRIALPSTVAIHQWLFAIQQVKKLAFAPGCYLPAPSDQLPMPWFFRAGLYFRHEWLPRDSSCPTCLGLTWMIPIRPRWTNWRSASGCIRCRSKTRDTARNG